MTKKIKNYLAVIGSALVLGIPVLIPATVAAQADNVSGPVKCGANLNADAINVDDPSCDVGDAQVTDKVNSTIKLVINAFSVVVGVTAVIMIIVGGFKYIISGGDSGNVTSAKNTILFAIIGLIVVALSQFIVRFVLARVSPS